MDSSQIITPEITPAWLSRSALEVAPDLIGCTLVRQFKDGTQLRGLIVETEAYEFGDPACHAYRKRTDRNAVMFGPAGYVYVYLIYGMYHCVNIVTDRDDFASAVLIRALQMEKIPLEIQARSKDKPDRIAAGPGKLCRVMAIDRSLTETQLNPKVTIGQEALGLEGRSKSWQQEFEQGKQNLMQTTRIGLTQGVDLPWRWYLKGNPAVSKL